jgi:shikimate kinase
MRRHVVLVGLPGAGKTAVGRLAARALGAPFVDVDARIEAREGVSIPRLFAERGEHAFRELERQEMEAALRGDPCIAAPGGGWTAQPDNMEYARGRALIVYLRAGVETAAARAAQAGARPLLEGGDRVDRMGALLDQRERHYLAADETISTDGRTAQEVAAELVQLARSHAGW